MINKFSRLSHDELEEHLSNYLIDRWSYSSLSCFSRNEKAFERRYIYREKGRSRVSSIAGEAYHEALKAYFEAYKAGKTLDVIALQTIAYKYLDDVKPGKWLTSKTMPTVEACVMSATSIVTALINNFLLEVGIYIAEIDEVLMVETHLEEWVCVNGVDAPLPLRAVCDLVVRLKSGKVVIIDHKSLKSFTPEEQRAMTGGKQAICYVLTIEKKRGITADEVWFIENKYSKNKDHSPQLRAIKIEIDRNTRRLYEALVYQHLKRVMEAVNDPDYIYTINDSDSLEDLPELYDFWMRTMIVEVDDFDIPTPQKELLKKRKKKTIDASVANISPKVIAEFRENAAAFITMDYSMTDMTNSEKIEHKLRSFGFTTSVAKVIDGFSSDTYLLEVMSGFRISDINRYKLDIASALGVSQITIAPSLRPHEGKSYVMINVTKKRERDLIFDPSALVDHRLPIGMDNFGELIVWDLKNHATPHVLICGATGSGKSVAIKATIEYTLLAGVDDIHIFDPKYEFCDMESSRIKIYNEIEDIEAGIALLVADMQSRSKRSINRMTMVIFDEYADALAQSRKGKALKGGKSLSEYMQMLMQKGRSSGFRVMLATQRASVKTIEGDTKVNCPVRICFRVPNKVDSVVVLGEEGAENLAGLGDGLIISPEYLGAQRFQGFYKP